MALTGFAAFVVVGLVVKVVVGRWMIQSGTPPRRDSDSESP